MPSATTPSSRPDAHRLTVDVDGPHGQALRVIERTTAELTDADEGGLAVTLDELAVHLVHALIAADLVHDPARILKLPASLSADDVTILQFEPAVQHAGAGSLVVQVPPVIGGDGLQDHELTAMSALVALIGQLPPQQQSRVALWAAGRWAHDGVVVG